MKIFTNEEAQELLTVLEQVVVGLGKVGSKYESRAMMESAVSYLLVKNKALDKLARARGILYQKYSFELKEGEVECELDRVLPETIYWEMPTEEQLLKWQKEV